MLFWPDGCDSIGMIVRSLKVLILEDHPFQLMALHQMLNALQVFDVRTAESVEDALQSLHSRGPVDIAICDLQMEGADGLELIRHLASERQANALIVLSSTTSYVLEGVARLAADQGLEVLGCLQKPASAAVLRELLDAYEHTAAERHEPGSDCPLQEPLSAHQLFCGSSNASSAAQWIAHFQPKVSLDGDVLGVEALVRWQHPVLGLLAPGSFMDIIEAQGLIVPLTWRVLDQALALSAQCLRERGQTLPVSVNIAPQVLQQTDFMEQVTQALARHQVPADALTLEILEQDDAGLQAWPLEVLLRLCMQGCKLSIDDFGMGASNIDRLLLLPFSELKIPTDFVRGMAEDARKSAVVAGAMLMAQRLSMTVVVEGVETLDDYHSLLALEASAIQGYFIARPMAAADLVRWLDERSRTRVAVHDAVVQDSPCSCK
ncbi:EAL domain-containing response regulator [Pseudomonas sp. DOAB1067]|uniref:EAL domain-containing response regulator n=1 Tax=Pseudomonas triticifolii TaxID=2762592 RepID=A0ABR7BC58_9PSED|nr:EAL domain-containing response regulator [Pseudomonas triticifolii]MBC3954515.1 EAL domain-containing response regulator [Pseudomonas triticifolii]